MRTKLFSGLLSLLIIFSLLAEVSPFSGKCDTVGEVQALADGIVAYKLGSSGSGSVQDWINGSLSSEAGASAEGYIVTLSQSGNYDFSAYESALCGYLSANDVSSASSREKYALALIASGSTSSYIEEAIDTSVGQQGIMSLVYGLHILNNGYTSSSFSAESVADQIISMQFADGGWAVIGSYGDVDVTAMAVQSLAPQYDSNSAVRDSVDRAVDFLAAKQQESGGFKSMGVENPESSAQVLTALSSLGIDCLSDERFIKGGRTVIDALETYRLSDGSFCHTEGGAMNENATVQAYYSLVSYLRMCSGQSPLYVLDNRRPQDIERPSDSGDSGLSGGTGSSGGGSSQSARTDSSGGGVSQVTDSGDDPDIPSDDDTPTDEQTTQGTMTSSVNSVRTTTTNVQSSLITTAYSAASTSKDTLGKGSSQTTSSFADSKTSSVTSSTVQTGSDGQTNSRKSGGYKVGAVIVIWGSAAVVCLILLILKKRNWKNFLAVVIIAVGATAVVLLTDIRSADDYYSGESAVKENAVGTVTMTIRCDKVAGENENIPEDGIILDVTEFQIEEGDSVYDILTEAAQSYGIQVDNTGSGFVYIAGINYLYEFDFGDLSGWIYHVNGESPSVGCGDYILSDGDRIEWLYTLELGNDLLEEE